MTTSAPSAPLRRRGRRWRAVALGVVVALGLSAGAGAATPPPSTTTTTTPANDGSTATVPGDYRAIMDKEDALLLKVSATVKKRQDLQLELLDLAGKVNEAQGRLSKAEAVLLRAEAASNQAQKELDGAKAKVASTERDLRRDLVASYVQGGRGQDTALNELLTPSAQAVTGRTMGYARAVVDHTKELLAQLRTAKAARDRSAQDVGRLRDDAKRQRDQIASEKAALEATQADRTKAESDLALQQFVELVAFNQLDQQKLAIIAKAVNLPWAPDGISEILNAAQKDEPPFVFPTIALQDPVPGSVFTQGFGPQGQPVLGVQGFHPGVDLAGPSGTPIHAAADGVVVKAGDGDGYGNVVVIDHGNHLGTLYGHQSQIMVKVGDKVKAGDVIGLRGTTGFSTGPHVHFETRVNGVPVDPLLFIRLVCPPGITDAACAAAPKP